MKVYKLTCVLLFCSNCLFVTAQKNKISATKAARQQLANEMEQSMNNELLNVWYPACVDSLYGGFFSTFTYDFKPAEDQDKFIVTQARHTWTNAKASEIYPSTAYYLKSAKHGFDFLKQVMWDSTYGGFYNLVDRQGNNKSNPKTPKDAYGNAFAIFALAAYYHASKDTAALSFVKKAFYWLEEHSHDPVHKGYYQHLQRNGTPVIRDASVPSTSDLGYKDQNSSIHLLEALTELYSIWPDPLVKERLAEMLYLVRDKITDKNGNLVLFFTPDWKPVSFKDSSEAVILKHKNLDHVSFGHDIETAFLMLEASQELGIKDNSKTMYIAKLMVDQSIKYGWDNTVGGFYDEGYYFKNKPGMTIIADSKNWWAQAEGMNSLLLMSTLYPADSMNYYGHFQKQWNYITTYLIDHEHGDWYDAGLDKSPNRKTALKGQIWKGAYHNFRAMDRCIKMLREDKVIGH